MKRIITLATAVAIAIPGVASAEPPEIDPDGPGRPEVGITQPPVFHGFIPADEFITFVPGEEFITAENGFGGGMFLGVNGTFLVPDLDTVLP